VIDTRPLSIAEVFGLSPLSQRAREAWLTLRGDPSTPPTRFDHTSLRMFKPRMALPLWRGRPAHGRLIPIYNLVSHVRPPPEAGWSVRVTFARDFLGTQLTYDSHNGTDFAVPVGTVVLAAAAGTVLRVSREFDRGGLKVFIDHGAGLVTTSNHLGRAFVRVGQRVRRGEPIALSAYSGLDGLSTFPFGAPHVHYNVWLNGEYVDPFGLGDTIPLWRNGNWPIPHRGDGVDDAPPTRWDHDAVARTLDACTHAGARADITAGESLEARAMNALFQTLYYPTRFTTRPCLYAEPAPRTPRLDLPFRAEDFDGIWFPHGVEPPR
jgi:murein DD-endopeptidase MepM/ murein hydrolase activator NlpD